MKKVGWLLLAATVYAGTSVFAGEPTFIEGKNIFIETGVDPVDRSPSWYAPMLNNTWKKGINNVPGEPVVLPESITWTPKVSSDEVIALKQAIKLQGDPTPYQVDLLRYQQWLHINDILERPLEESYQTKVIEGFKWADWIDSTKVIANPHVRTDKKYKNFPYRSRPIENPKP